MAGAAVAIPAAVLATGGGTPPRPAGDRQRGAVRRMAPPPRPRWARAITGSAALLIAVQLIGGCALLPISSPRVPVVHSESAPPATDSRYRDYRGVIHIHTTYSDGTGTYAEITRTARRQRLDFLIVTDHNTMQAYDDGQEGWRPSAEAPDRVLVLANAEISAPDGHVLGIGMTQPVARDQSSQAIIDDITRQGGLAFLAHPHYVRKPWTHWDVTGFTGLEIYNLVEDASAEHKLRLCLRGVACSPDAFYRRLIRRPTKNLERWDRLLAGGNRVVGIGAADAHGLRPFRLRLAPYDLLFKTIRTHVLAPELSRAHLLEALRLGRAYTAMDILGDATGFVFRAESAAGGAPAHMGDEIAWQPGLELLLYTPTPAELHLYRDGRRIAERHTQRWRFPVETPGVYRVEAFLHGRFWIASNPIYIRPLISP